MSFSDRALVTGKELNMPGWSKVMPEWWKVAAAFIAVIFLISLPAFADDDPPGRVARVSYLSGDVSMQPGGVDDWTAAKLNRPLTSGDRLWTSRDARAELQIGNASLRLNEETSFTLSNLNDTRVQMQVAQGSVNVRVRKLYEDETFEINTPNFTVSLLRAGEYRIDVNNDADVSVMTVRAGSAQVEGGGQSVTVHPRQQVTFRDSNNPTYDVASAAGRDNFDEWCDARISREDRALSAKYTSRDVIGYEDLDDYGNWRVYGSYGRVWVPSTVVTGWAPYRYGHWEWIYPWGWTWIDDAPWGFAPFHYGRWVYAPFGWAWVPGPVYVRPVYAPALVAWIGGRHWGVGLSFGGGYGYGWLPLGPREPFIPWYRGSRHYWSRVNVHNTYINNTYITNVYNRYNNCRGNCGDRDDRRIRYANRNVPNGVTVVDRDTLVGSRHVGRNAMRVNPDVIRKAPMMARLDETPSRESVLGERGQGRVNRPPERAFARPVVAKSVAPRPAAFEDKVRMYRGEGSRPDLSAGDRGNRELGPGRSGGPELRSVRERAVPRPPSEGGAAGEPKGMRGPKDRVAGGSMRREIPRPPERGGNGWSGRDSDRQEAMGPRGGAERGAMEPRGSADARSRREVPRPPEGFRPDRDGSPGNVRERDGGRPERPSDSMSRPGGSSNEGRVPRPQSGDRETPSRSVDRGTMDMDRGPREVRPERGGGTSRGPEMRSEPRVWRSPDSGGRAAGGGREMRGPQGGGMRSAPEVRQSPSGGQGGGGTMAPAPRGNPGGGGGVRNHPGRG